MLRDRKFLYEVADSLEKTAAVIDAHEAEKQAAVRKERADAIDILGRKFAEATGAELPVDVREKLAASDKSILETVETMVEKTAGGRVERLGGPGEKQASDRGVALSKKERAQAAWDTFGTFITSNS